MKKQEGDRVTKAELARRWGCSRANITQMAKRGSILVGADGLVDFAEANRAFQARLPEGITLAEAVRRKEIALAGLRELELAHKSGRLIDVDEVKKQQCFINGNVASRLRALPSKLTPQLIGISNHAQVNAILTREVRATLEALVTIAGTLLEDPN